MLSIYERELVRFLKEYREYRGEKHCDVQNRMQELLTDDEARPAWIPKPERNGAIANYERKAKSKTPLTRKKMNEVYLLADAYQIPYLMLDPIAAEPDAGPIACSAFSEFLKPQDHARAPKNNKQAHYGEGTEYSVPPTRLTGTDTAFVRLLLKLNKSSSDAHSHPGDELLFVKRGKVQLNFVSSGVSTILETGSFAHFYAEQPHSLESVSEEECEIFVIRFYQLDPKGTRLSAIADIHDLFEEFRRKQNRHLSESERTNLRERIIPWVSQATAKQFVPHRDLTYETNDLEIRDFVGLGLLLREFERTQDLNRDALAKRAVDRQWGTRSMLQTLMTGEGKSGWVKFENLQDLEHVFDIAEPLFYPYLFPVVPRCVVVPPQDCVTINSNNDVKYDVPIRKLAGSDTAITFFEMKPNSTSVPNRHPGFEAAIPIHGSVKVVFDENDPNMKGDWATESDWATEGSVLHFRSNLLHKVVSGNDGARVLLIRFFESHN